MYTFIYTCTHKFIYMFYFYKICMPIHILMTYTAFRVYGAQVSLAKVVSGTLTGVLIKAYEDHQTQSEDSYHDMVGIRE